jgi:hypothetical protein
VQYYRVTQVLLGTAGEQQHVTPVHFAVLGTLQCGEEYGGEEPMESEGKNVGQERDRPGAY